VSVICLLACATIANGQHPSFFSGEVALSGGVYWLQFADGNLFGYYNYQEFPNLYHYDLGFENFIDAADGQSGAYLYDYASQTWFYTNPADFPYLYDFTVNHWLIYQLATNNPGHYTSNPRTFFDTTLNVYVELGATGNTIELIPPATPSSLTIAGATNNGGDSWSAAAGVTASFTFTYHDSANGAQDIAGGQVSLVDSAGTSHCPLSWTPTALVLDDGNGRPQRRFLYGVPWARHLLDLGPQRGSRHPEPHVHFCFGGDIHGGESGV
jgi:hypothetical protein